MIIRDAGSTIKEIRLNRGLTQEELSEGICSPVSLSRIENGHSGVSPSTFNALMERMGVHRESYPMFSGKSEFDLYYSLKKARFYLDSLQLKAAYTILCECTKKGFENNKFYYQEWILLTALLQIHLGENNYSKLEQTVREALQLTCNFSNDDKQIPALLSKNEIELLLVAAYCNVEAGRYNFADSIISNLEINLKTKSFTDLEKGHIMLFLNLIRLKLYLKEEKYNLGIPLAENQWEKAAKESITSFTYEIVYLLGYSYHMLQENEKANYYFNICFYAAYSIKSQYALVVKNEIAKLGYVVREEAREIKWFECVLPKIEEIPQGIGVSYSIQETPYMVGDIIRDLRKEKEVSQEQLCRGVCTKSNLSKIENGFLEPDIFLSEVLLQRLGISDRVFTFFGSKHEAKLHKYVSQAVLANQNEPEKQRKYLKQIEGELQAGDKIPRQYYKAAWAEIQKDNSRKQEMLENALAETLVNFDINNICEYLLSWNELSILNVRANALCFEGKTEMGILFFSQILRYEQEKKTDIMFGRNIYPVTLYLLVHHLYCAKKHEKILDIKSYMEKDFMKCAPRFLSIVLGYYSQVLGECGQKEEAALYGKLAYSDYMLSGLRKHAELMKKFLKEDFDITIF